MAHATRSEAAIERVEVSAYTIPTQTPQESDGTLVWSSTSIVLVEVYCGGLAGLGYTYCDPAAAKVVQDQLAGAVEGCDALMPQRAWAQMQVLSRQLGQTGVAAMAVSALDIALWDLKAKLLGVCLADALPRYRESARGYGSGGFCDLDDAQLARQVEAWREGGFQSVKIKVGRDARDDRRRVELLARLTAPETELMVDANGANVPAQASEQADTYRELGAVWFEEPVSSQDLAGLARVRSRAPGGLAIAAGEYGWNLPYFQRMLDAEAVDVLQADVTRCGGITNMLRIDGLCKARSMPFSAHCAPTASAHVCCAMETAVHLEYFWDHQRIEQLVFDGALEPSGGLLTPDRERPGLGLEVRVADIARYEV